MRTQYITEGICVKQIDIELEDGNIKDIEFIGGCDGNLQGLSRLLVGMSADEAIKSLRGIRCGNKDTSCPDQLSRALEALLTG